MLATIFLRNSQDSKQTLNLIAEFVLTYLILSILSRKIDFYCILYT